MPAVGALIEMVARGAPKTGWAPFYGNWAFSFVATKTSTPNHMANANSQKDKSRSDTEPLGSHNAPSPMLQALGRLA
jgi:hypothetical protein